MRRRQQREVWQALGQDDADWAVLTVPNKRSGGWAEDLEAFYASGRAEVADALKLAEPPARTKALDYGAGTGRLSMALAAHFDAVTSIDVSEAMLRTTRERAAMLGVPNVTPTLVDAFEPNADHDFALSLLVLQHLPSRTAVEQAVALIASALRPGGVAVLEIPERALLWRARIQPRLRIYAILRTLGVSAQRLQHHGFSGISMLTIDEASARRMFSRAGFEVVSRVLRPDYNYDYVRWIVRRHA